MNLYKKEDKKDLLSTNDIINQLFEEEDYLDKKKELEEYIEKLKQSEVDFFECCYEVGLELRKKYTDIFKFLEDIKQESSLDTTLSEKVVNDIKKIVDREELYFSDKLEEVREVIQKAPVVPIIFEEDEEIEEDNEA
jgi:hypothetical protein